MALSAKTLGQIRSLQAAAAREGILLVALPVDQAFGLIDAANYTAAHVRKDDRHAKAAQAGAAAVSDALETTGLMHR